VIYDHKEESGRGGAVWHFSRDGEEVVVTLKGRLRVSAAEGVRAAVLAGAGIAVGTEWMFTPEVADGTVKEVLRDWELPASAIWAIFPAGRAASTKARAFVSFVREVMSPQSTAVAGSKRFAAGNSALTPQPKHRSLRLEARLGRTWVNHIGRAYSRWE
jgi:DNA-binding transcriptional LysR family regulator